jgi:hypothetical protein
MTSTMKFRPLSIALVVLLGATPLLSRLHAQDVEAMMKWGAADVIKYHIVGVYSAKTDVVAGGEVGYADVTDRVVIDLTWKLSEAKLVGTPTVVNEKSAVKNLANYEPKCAPPTLKGEYEHFTALSIKDGLAGSVEIQVQQVYPAANVIQFCTGAPKAVAAKTETRPEEFMVVSPMIFAMPTTSNSDVTISADKKSIIVKKGGWTWTYTPTV